MRPFTPLLCLCLMCFACTYAWSQNEHAGDYLKNKAQQVLPLTSIRDLTSFKELFGSTLTLSSLSIESSVNHNRGLIVSDQYTSTSLFQYDIKTSAGIDIKGIPLKAEYIRRESEPNFLYNSPKNIYKVQFDVEKYKDKWKRLAEKIGPAILTKSGEQLEALKKDLSSRLTDKVKTKIKEKSRPMFDSLSGSVELPAFEGKSPEEIGQQLFGQNITRMLNDAKLKLEEIRSASMTEQVKDSLIQQWNEKISDLEEKSIYTEKLHAVVKEAVSSGTLNELKELGTKSKQEFDTLLKDPAALAKLLGEKFNIGGIDKLLTLVSQFRLGAQQLPFSGNELTPMLSKGISFELEFDDKFIGFSTGQIIPVNNTLLFNAGNLPALDSLGAQDKPFYWTLRYRKGKLSGSHKGVKMTSISHKGLSNYQLQPASFKKMNTLLVDLYSKERIFGDNWLQVEVSKSISDSEKDKPKINFFNLDNTSVKVLLEGRFEKAGITHQAYFNKLQGAYNNIGQSYLSSNGYETGFSFRMKQPKGKLTSYIRGNLRKFILPGQQSSWQNLNIRGRLTYKLKKGQSVQFAGLWQNGYRSYWLNASPVYIKQQSKGLSGDINLVNKRIFGLYNTSFISVGYQQDIFPLTPGINGNNSLRSSSYSVMLNQAFLYLENLLQANIYYTKVSQGANEYLYNTKLDIDAGGVFKLNDDLSAGVSLVYGYFKGAYTNWGVRSSLSAKLFKKIQIELNNDIRKNIKLENPLFDQFFNMAFDIRYTIK